MPPFSNPPPQSPVGQTVTVQWTGITDFDGGPGGVQTLGLPISTIPPTSDQDADPNFVEPEEVNQIYTVDQAGPLGLINPDLSGNAGGSMADRWVYWIMIRVPLPPGDPQPSITLASVDGTEPDVALRTILPATPTGEVIYLSTQFRIPQGAALTLVSSTALPVGTRVRMRVATNPQCCGPDTGEAGSGGGNQPATQRGEIVIGGADWGLDTDSPAQASVTDGFGNFFNTFGLNAVEQATIMANVMIPLDYDGNGLTFVFRAFVGTGGNGGQTALLNAFIQRQNGGDDFAIRPFGPAQAAIITVSNVAFQYTDVALSIPDAALDGAAPGSGIALRLQRDSDDPNDNFVATLFMRSNSVLRWG